MKKDMVLSPIRPNAGLTAIYRERMETLIDDMHKSIAYWIAAQWRENEPEEVEQKLALDASPSADLAVEMRKLSSRWQSRFNDTAKELAAFFAKAAADRSDLQLKAILRKGGFAIKFRMTRAMNDALQATVAEQVGLIKSIPQKYLLDVQGAVMRSVQAGHDLGALSKKLQDSYGVAKRRAALIARDQNAKAVATFNRVRQTELGIKQAIWVHSGGGHHPRPSHLKAGADKIVYDVAKGWLDPDVGEYIYPGQLVNCRCVSRSIIPGFV